jgi:hypothetical protein
VTLISEEGRSARGRALEHTHAVGEVCNQVVDFDLADLELAVQPAAVRLAV